MDAIDTAAFGTVLALGLATGGGVLATTSAINAGATAKAIMLGVASTFAAGGSLASISAWVTTKGENGSVQDYFSHVLSQGAAASAGMIQFVSQTFFQAAVQGIGDAIRSTIGDAITGNERSYRVI